jgi:hypothetical protein
MEQLHHGGIQDCSDDASLSNVVISLKSFVNNNGASVRVSGGYRLHPEPIGVFCSAGKALVVKRAGFFSRY